MLLHGYDISITSTQYETGGPAELGNYLAEQIQLYGYTDGSNELGGHVNCHCWIATKERSFRLHTRYDNFTLINAWDALIYYLLPLF